MKAAMKTASEKRILTIVGAVQFINIVDFMMVMPLGPDFAEALGIPSSKLGIIGASYTFAAFVSGLLSSLYLDKFDRRKALLVCLVGLLCGTALGGFATSYETLILARMVAGAFGGPASALGFAIVSDVVPPERRGRALGAVMGAFSAASVLGVPAGLEVARLGGWQAPFFALSFVGLILAVSSLQLLPPLTGHIRNASDRAPLKEIAQLAKNGTVRLALFTQFMTMSAGFLLIPNLSAYFQYNAGFPRENIGLLYMVGGAISFFTMRLAGKIIDRKGILPVVSWVTVILCFNIFEAFYFGAPSLPVFAIFILFMICQSSRNVSVQTITTKVPPPQIRASFQSLQSAVQHLATSAGAFVSTLFLKEVAGPKLDGMRGIAIASILMSISIPFLLTRLEHRLKGQEH